MGDYIQVLKIYSKIFRIVNWRWKEVSFEDVTTLWKQSPFNKVWQIIVLVVIWKENKVYFNSVKCVIISVN